MNSYSARKSRNSVEQTATATTVAETTAVNRLAADTEITEITVRVRPTERPSLKSQGPNFNEFDVTHLRPTEAEAVRVESLVKGFVDQRQGRREAPRFAKSLTVVVYQNNQSFRTSTENISAGGALLKDSLPRDFQYGKIEILFIQEDDTKSSKQYFMFKGEALANTGPTNRIKFTSGSKAAQDALSHLLQQLDPKLIVA
jgi:hypothetical protein